MIDERFYDVQLLILEVQHDAQFVKNIFDLALQCTLSTDIEKWCNKLAQIGGDSPWRGDFGEVPGPVPQMLITQGLSIVLRRRKLVPTTSSTKMRKRPVGDGNSLDPTQEILEDSQ